MVNIGVEEYTIISSVSDIGIGLKTGLSIKNIQTVLTQKMMG
jgi:hypothetical protein